MEELNVLEQLYLYSKQLYDGAIESNRTETNPLLFLQNIRQIEIAKMFMEACNQFIPQDKVQEVE